MVYNIQTLLKTSYCFLFNKQGSQILYFGSPLLLYREIVVNEIGTLFYWPTTRKHFWKYLTCFFLFNEQGPQILYFGPLLLYKENVMQSKHFGNYLILVLGRGPYFFQKKLVSYFWKYLTFFKSMNNSAKFCTLVPLTVI